MSERHYHIDLFDAVLTFRWSVTCDGRPVDAGNEATPEMALEAAQHAIDLHAAAAGLVFVERAA